MALLTENSLILQRRPSEAMAQRCCRARACSAEPMQDSGLGILVQARTPPAPLPARGIQTGTARPSMPASSRHNVSTEWPTHPLAEETIRAAQTKFGTLLRCTPSALNGKFSSCCSCCRRGRAGCSRPWHRHRQHSGWLRAVCAQTQCRVGLLNVDSNNIAG